MMKRQTRTNPGIDAEAESGIDVLPCGDVSGGVSGGGADGSDGGARAESPRNLADEVGKKGPFDSRSQEAFLNLVRTQEVLANEFEQFFKSHGLSSAQYNALRILRGHAPQPLACSTIAREMVTREPDITRLIDRLERAGFATRQRCSEDRRVVRVRITESAMELLGRMDKQVLGLHRRQLAHMSDADLETLNELLFRARHPDLFGGGSG